MIRVTTLRGAPLVINAELIEFVESTPDTVVSLVTGRKCIVREPMEEVVALVREYRAAVSHSPAPLLGRRPAGEDGEYDPSGA